MPPPTVIALASLENHAPNPNVVCPPAEAAPASQVDTHVAPSIPEDTNFVGPIGIVGPVAPHEQPAQRGPQDQVPATTASEEPLATESRQDADPATQTAAVTSPPPIEEKKPEPEPKPTAKHETAVATTDRACIYSRQQPENPKSFSSTLRLENPRLAMGGIMGLLATLVMVVRRSRRPALPKLARQAR